MSTRIVFVKELVDGARDRRSLVALLILPFIGPLALSLAFTRLEQAVERPTTLPVVGREHAPALVSFLEARGVGIEAGPGDPLEAVRTRRAALVLIIPASYRERYKKSHTVTVELLVDRSRHDSAASIRKVKQLIEGYSGAVGSLRLLARGVSPEVATPLHVAEIDLSTPKQRAAIFLNMVPMLVLLAAFVGGAQFAADATAGERERGSLEPLLITPVSRWRLMLGKWLAAVVFSAGAMLATLASTLFALSFVPAEQLGLVLELSASDIALVAMVALPLAILFPAVQLLVASFARSVREAQTYMSLAVFVPMLPAMLTSFEVLGSARWMAVIPVLAQQSLITSLVRGDGIEPLGGVLAATSAVVLALASVRASAWLMRRERVVFGR